MANLAEKREPRAWSPRAVWAAIDELRNDLRYLRSSVGLVKQAQATTVSHGVQVDDNSETFPNFTWTEFAVTEVAVPDGFTRATVILYASVGGSFSGGGGNVGVCPIIGDFNSDIYWLQGPAISNGTFGAGPVSCSSVAFLDIPLLIQPVLRLSALCQSTDGSGTVIPGTNNVHLSAQIVFGR
jgi:hypothetical protein